MPRFRFMKFFLLTVLISAFGGSGAAADCPWHWVRLQPSHAPSVRTDAAMAGDFARGTVVLFGGFDGQKCLGDTWVWTGTDWVRYTGGPSPEPRQDACMVYDPVGGEVLLTGGFDQAVFTDTWAWNGSTWRKVGAASGTLPPAGMACTYWTPVLGHPELLCLTNPGTNLYSYSTYRWATNHWTPTGYAGDFPEGCRPVYGFSGNFSTAPGTLAADETGRPVGFGGISNCGAFGFMGNQQTRVDTGTGLACLSGSTQPEGRYSQAMASLPRDAGVVLFGGKHGEGHCYGVLSDTWLFAGGGWRSLDTPAHPQAQSNAAMTLSGDGNAVLFFGSDGQTWVFRPWGDTEPDGTLNILDAVDLQA